MWWEVLLKWRWFTCVCADDCSVTKRKKVKCSFHSVFIGDLGAPVQRICLPTCTHCWGMNHAEAMPGVSSVPPSLPWSVSCRHTYSDTVALQYSSWNACDVFSTNERMKENKQRGQSKREKVAEKIKQVEAGKGNRGREKGIQGSFPEHVSLCMLCVTSQSSLTDLGMTDNFAPIIKVRITAWWLHAFTSPKEQKMRVRWWVEEKESGGFCGHMYVINLIFVRGLHTCFAIHNIIHLSASPLKPCADFSLLVLKCSSSHPKLKSWPEMTNKQHIQKTML